MSAQPGWYPDPSGDTSKLRWWDGQVWTEHYHDIVSDTAVAPLTETNQETQVAATTNETATESVQPAQIEQAASFTESAVPVQSTSITPPAAPVAPSAPEYVPTSASPQDAYANTQYSVPPTPPVAPSYAYPSGADVIYHVSEDDKTKLLVAFVFSVISCVTSVLLFFLIIPLISLCWLIPMTYHTWKIYQGKALNNTAFSICMLIFVSVVAGILMLVSERPGDSK